MIPVNYENIDRFCGNIVIQGVCTEQKFDHQQAEGGITMETYIILANYTQKGAANIKESPARIQAVRKAVEAAGGKWGGWYLTMGQYDIVLIVQAPNAQVAASLLLAIGSQGNVSTQSLRAFTEAEFTGLVASVP